VFCFTIIDIKLNPQGTIFILIYYFFIFKQQNG